MGRAADVLITLNLKKDLKNSKKMYIINVNRERELGLG